MEIQENRLEIGSYHIIPISTGIFGLDGGAMFGTVPKILWEKLIPADAQNRIPMEARALLLKSTDPQQKKNILIDCGNGRDFTEKFGDKLGPKFAQMYNIDPQGPSLLKSLKNAGITCDEITDVIFTHLHFDHCGGGTVWSDGRIAPQFPNATYYVQKENLLTAQSPNIRERASYLAQNFAPLLEMGCLKVLDGPREELLPGISVGISNGHTRGQQWVKVSDSKNTLIYCGDVIPTSAHVRSAWIMGYDLDPLKIIEEKTTILTNAANYNWYLFFEHDPKIDACKVVKNGSDFTVSETFKLLA
jgi:glyoxylase-like metal-dependent hydrolase (beta-lactamase superfamily II)